MREDKVKVMLLAGKGKSSNIVYNYLSEYFDVFVIFEQPEPKAKFLKRRIKRLGLWEVIGQILFIATILPFLKLLSRKRMSELIMQHELNTNSIHENYQKEVGSINKKVVRGYIEKFNPEVIVVNGTRIIGKRLLRSTKVKFINTHAGITPLYRGVHGGYWALFEGDKDNCGVTVHLVDEGVDTGNIIFQANIEPTRVDNFSTYPLLQLATGLPLLKDAILSVARNEIQFLEPRKGHSRLWFHPTIFQYLSKYFSKGVK